MLAALRNISFCLCWLFIGLSSSYDAYLNLKHQVTPATELNPIAYQVLTEAGIPGLIGIKFAGTVLALGILALIYTTWPQTALRVALGLSLIQSCVLLFLLFA